MTKSATERAEAQQWAEYVQYLENEIERLHAEIEARKTAAEKVYLEQYAVIERLRRDNEHLTNSMMELAIQVRHLTEQLDALEPKP